MTESTKKSIRDVVLIFSGFGVYTLIAVYVPDDSLFKKIFSVLMVIAFIGCTIWFTPLGNPLKRYLIAREKKRQEDINK